MKKFTAMTSNAFSNIDYAKSPKRYVYEICDYLGWIDPGNARKVSDGYRINYRERSEAGAQKVLNSILDAAETNNIEVVRSNIAKSGSNWYISVVVPENKEVESATCVEASLSDSGLTYRDDGLLFQFIYDWYKVWDQFPPYEEVLDEWDDRVSESAYRDAAERLGRSLQYVKYYTADHGETYLELSDNPTWNYIQVPDEILSDYGSEAVWEVFQDKIDWAVDRFEVKSGTDLELLGRNGKHVCVDDTVNNVLRYPDLQTLAKQLENSVIYQMENLTDKDFDTFIMDEFYEEV